MKRAITVRKTGEGVGISRYQYHHSSAVMRIKIEGAMIKGRASLSISLLIFCWMYRLQFGRKLFVCAVYFFDLGVIIFRRNFGMGVLDD